MNVINKYIEMAVIQMECTYSGDYRSGNKASVQLEKMNIIFKNNFDENIIVIDELIDSENPNVILWISQVAFAQKYREKEIIDKLEQISCNQNLGIIRLNAEMVLKAHMR